MSGGGGIPGKRQRPKGGRQTPGSIAGNMDPRGSGSAPPPPGPINTRGGVDRGSSNTSKSRAEHGELNSIAPLPVRPLIYPVGSRFYRILITFEIELISSPIAPKSDDTANLSVEDGEIGS